VWERKETERKGEEKVETGFLRGIGSVCACLPVVPSVSVCLSINRLAPDRFLGLAYCALDVALLDVQSTRYDMRLQHVPLLQLEGLRGKGFHSRHFSVKCLHEGNCGGSQGGALASHRPIAIGPPALRTTWMPCQTRHVAHFLRTGSPVTRVPLILGALFPSGRPPGPPSNRPLHLLPVYAHTFSFHSCSLRSRAVSVLVKDSSSQHCQPLQQPASVSGVTHCSPTNLFRKPAAHSSSRRKPPFPGTNHQSPTASYIAAGTRFAIPRPLYVLHTTDK
jgi:hypothetical protein